MKISKINYYQGDSSTCFRSAVPVFIHTIPKGKTITDAVPVVTDEMARGYMKQLTLYLNNSLKTNTNTERDTFIKTLRQTFGKFLKDFCNPSGKIDSTSQVQAFTCVDGGVCDKKLNPLFYYATGDTKRNLEKLETDYAEAKKLSCGYQTAEVERMKRIYPSRGKNIINTGYAQLQKDYGSPIAFHVYFSDEYTKNGNFIRHKIEHYEFKSAKAKNPSISLTK